MFVIHCLEKCLSKKRFVEKVKCCQTDGTGLTYFLMINNKERVDEGTRVLDNYLQSRSVIRSTYLADNCHRFRDKLIKTSDINTYVSLHLHPTDVRRFSIRNISLRTWVFLLYNSSPRSSYWGLLSWNKMFRGPNNSQGLQPRFTLF